MHVGHKSKFCPSLKVHGTIMPEETEEKFLGRHQIPPPPQKKNLRIQRVQNYWLEIIFGPQKCWFKETYKQKKIGKETILV